MAQEKENKKPNEARMTIWEHLSELRRRLTVIIIALLVAVVVIYFFAPDLIFILIQPVAGWISGQPVETIEQMKATINVFDPLGGFTLRFKVSLFFGVIATSPIWIWQAMAFFLPALKPNEKKWVVPTFFVAVLLFAGGLVFCYFIILDPAFGFLLSQTQDFATVFANASEYISMILLFEIAFGLAFQLPLIVFYLVVFNIVPYKKLRSSWRVVYVALLVFSAMVTPDASPVTMILMFAAMLLLYEISLLASRIVLRKRIKTLEEMEAAKEEEEEETKEIAKDVENA